jgi:hypothetical protein
VSHKKKYDLISFSKYQISTARELILQYFIKKDKNMVQEFCSSVQPLYKKLWFLRPVLGFLFFLTLICLAFGGKFLPLSFLGCIIVSSFLVEYPFRIYLFCKASPFVSFAAWFLYFYEGLLICIGVLIGIVQVISLKCFKNAPCSLFK